MGKKRNRLQNCSASIDADKAGEPSPKAKKESDDSEIVNLKKQKKPSVRDEKSDLKKETKEMRISFKEMVEATKKLVDLIPTKADLQDTTLLKKNDEDGKATLKKESDEDEKSALKKERDEDEDTALKMEIEEMTNSFKEMSEFVNKLQENILTKTDLLKYSFKEKVEEIYECCFETEDAKGNNEGTIFVFGFKRSLTREDTKSTLKKHFSSCGEVARVYVPIECKTGTPLGFAFIDMKEDEVKALTLNGSYLGKLRLLVTMAKDREEYFAYKNFKGCERCCRARRKRCRDRYVETHGGRIQRIPGVQEFFDAKYGKQGTATKPT